MYAWSYRALTSRMSFLDTKFISYDILAENVALAVRKEMQGSRKSLGYRVLTKEIQEVNCINTPRNVVYDAMSAVNPETLVECDFVGRRKRPPRGGSFVSMVRT